MAAVVTECERVQLHWFNTRARLLGGQVWQDGPLSWVHGPDGLNLMFPARIPADALARGVQRAAEAELPIVGAWLGLDVDATALAGAGFERGWRPLWMAARPTDVGAPDYARTGSPSELRIEFQETSPDYEREDPGYRAQVTVAQDRPQHSWYAAAYLAGHFAGRAWSHVAGTTAGVFDMQVWPPFRRRGVGTALLRAVCAAVSGAGARRIVLNATDEGRLLYERYGFSPVGEGITWWLHREP
jgi:GNAT superfamily N-acetyltransferase